jgi:hypothetical protein
MALKQKQWDVRFDNEFFGEFEVWSEQLQGALLGTLVSSAHWAFSWAAERRHTQGI